MQKENEEDGSITFSFPKGYRFRGGIEDAPPADDGTTDSGETVVTTLQDSLPQDWGCCVVCGIDRCKRHASPAAPEARPLSHAWGLTHCGWSGALIARVQYSFTCCPLASSGLSRVLGTCCSAIRRWAEASLLLCMLL